MAPIPVAPEHVIRNEVSETRRTGLQACADGTCTEIDRH